MTVTHLKPVKANAFTLRGTRPDGEPCIAQVLLTEDAPLETLQESLSALFARFAEEVVKPAPPPAPADPIFSDPSVLTKSYDAIYKDARAAGIVPRDYINQMRADGWEHMPNHAAMQRRVPE